VIVAKLDRLTRSVKDLCGLLELFEKRKVALISVTESLDTGSAAGRLVITIIGAVSQWEREAIGERTRDALQHKRGNGERVGNIEFGYRLSADGLHLEPDLVEQAALSAIRELRTGGHSLRRIAATLNGHGHRTRRGTEVAVGIGGPRGQPVYFHKALEIRLTRARWISDGTEIARWVLGGKRATLLAWTPRGRAVARTWAKRGPPVNGARGVFRQWRRLRI
jgi:DNA invertase Pin-like site-specific DNA recombinase